MIRKTYGVSGLMDWTTQIKAGKGSKIRVFGKMKIFRRRYK